MCSDCYNKVARCFKCKHFDIEEDLVKCSVPYCGKFYHSKVHCYISHSIFLLCSKQLLNDQCMDEGEHSSKNVCNLHRCCECAESCLQFHKRKSLWKCFRCPKAFDLKHRPRDVHIIAGEYFMCIKHVNEVEVVPEMGPEIKEKIMKRRKVCVPL